MPDLFKEINNITTVQSSTSIRDREPFIKRILNVFLEKGFVSVLEDFIDTNKQKNSDKGFFSLLFLKNREEV